MSSEIGRGQTLEWTTQQESTDPFPSPAASEPQVTTPSITTVLETVLGLRSQELVAFEAVRADPGIDTKDLASVLDRDRSNVNRSLTKLENAGLVTRHRRILDSGGFYYANYAAPNDVVDEVVSTALDQWLMDARSTVDEHQWDGALTD
jgi:predicted transcriptional regulator